VDQDQESRLFAGRRQRQHLSADERIALASPASWISSKTEPVKTPQISPILETLDPVLKLTPDTAIRDFCVDDASLEGQNMEGVVFRSGQFTRASFRDASLPRLELSDVRLLDCDLANAQLVDASLLRVELTRCRLIGTRLTECYLQDVRLTNCVAKLSQFRFSKLISCHFDGCDLRDTDFQGADLTNALFTACDLRNVEMSQAVLTGTDLTSSNIEGLRVNQESLKGLILEPHQAASVASLFGVKVRWT
jgi:uncharacterized protein YjbI with pentapeptide repeats